MINCGDGEGHGWFQFDVEFEFKAQQNIICTYYYFKQNVIFLRLVLEFVGHIKQFTSLNFERNILFKVTDAPFTNKRVFC